MRRRSVDRPGAFSFAQAYAGTTQRGLVQMPRMRLLAVAVAAAAVAGCDAGDASTSGPAPAARTPRLVALPAPGVAACRRAQAHARFTVLCPARLPRAIRALTPTTPPAPFEVQGGADALHLGYGGVA